MKKITKTNIHLSFGKLKSKIKLDFSKGTNLIYETNGERIRSTHCQFHTLKSTLICRKISFFLKSIYNAKFNIANG